MRGRSIPEEHHAKVIKWFLAGETYRDIAERLGREYDVETSAGSVHRLIGFIARGDCSEGVMRTVLKIRSNAPRLADKLHEQLALSERMAGIDVPGVELPAGMTQKALDFVNKLTVRELKLAGCLGRDAERALEKAQEIAYREYQIEQDEAELELLQAQHRPIPQPPPEPSRASSNVQVSPVPLRRAVSPKQGPNESCACGSGVKFKRCCGSGSPRRDAAPPLQALTA